MIKRTIEISSRGIFLSVVNDQLVIRSDGTELQRVPIEDVGVLLLASTATVYTHAVISRVLGAGAVIVACDDNHLPCGLILPQNNTLQSERLGMQIQAKKPLLKQLWRQVVMAKIAHQAAVLPEDEPVREALLAARRRVRSGDPSNVEAQAAKAYWRALFPGGQFHRDRDGPPPNNLLNYGYMVLRAAVARAVAGAGLHPSLGLYHHNRYNPFCLADDLVEPLRPTVDLRVKRLWQAGQTEVTRETRADLLSVLTAEVRTGEQTGPLMVGLERMAASLVRCYAGQQKSLEIPVPCI
jgi:CRISPR-associated protein Cas1